MKRILSLILALCLPLVLAAGCGAKDEPASTSPDDRYPGIDFSSTQLQQMSEERAAKEKLEEVVWDFLNGATIFPEGSDESKLTYTDFAEFIGCDASEYNFDALQNARVYTWIAMDADASKFGAWFKERNGIWYLSMTGSVNL